MASNPEHGNQAARAANICPRCGASFHCSAHHTCWCAHMVLPESLLDYLAAAYGSCLCESCLRQYASDFPHQLPVRKGDAGKP